MAADISIQIMSYRVALPRCGSDFLNACNKLLHGLPQHRQRKSSQALAANIPQFHATNSQASGSLPRQDTDRSCKKCGKEKSTTATAAKEPVACKGEDSIISHPGLPCQYMGHIVSMPKHQPRLAISSLPKKWKLGEHILGGTWKRRSRSLKLEWWSPTVGAYPTQAKCDWFWIRALGLPLQLWSEKVMKQIGDECGGWLETEEETMLKNHLRWARIKVKGRLEEIPRFVEVADGDTVFSLPIWVEAPARYRKVNGGKLFQREERDKIWKEVDSLAGSLKMKETEYE
ncbi:hypothetical protein FXO37_18913 [Capsicum annuum]|nr:hypothetical protein FXO37_18913 [Capsicum annuum]